ncbi:hypothetical protein QBC32DRAFT_409542, partial [Pseudoneurospora amorphoporcata]
MTIHAHLFHPLLLPSPKLLLLLLLPPLQRLLRPRYARRKVPLHHSQSRPSPCLHAIVHLSAPHAEQSEMKTVSNHVQPRKPQTMPHQTRPGSKANMKSEPNLKWKFSARRTQSLRGKGSESRKGCSEECGVGLVLLAGVVRRRVWPFWDAVELSPVLVWAEGVAWLSWEHALFERVTGFEAAIYPAIVSSRAGGFVMSGRVGVWGVMIEFHLPSMSFKMPTPMNPSLQRKNAFSKKPRGNKPKTISDITTVLYGPSGSSSSDSICDDASITETFSDMPYVSTVPMIPRRSTIFEPSGCYTEMDTDKDPIDSKPRFCNCRCARCTFCAPFFRFANMGTDNDPIDSFSSPYNPHRVCCNLPYSDCERSNPFVEDCQRPFGKEENPYDGKGRLETNRFVGGRKVHNPNDPRAKIFEQRERFVVPCRPLKSLMYWNKNQKVTLADVMGTEMERMHKVPGAKGLSIGKGQGQMQELDVGIGGKKTEEKGFFQVMAGFDYKYSVDMPDSRAKLTISPFHKTKSAESGRKETNASKVLITIFPGRCRRHSSLRVQNLFFSSACTHLLLPSATYKSFSKLQRIFHHLPLFDLSTPIPSDKMSSLSLEASLMMPAWLAAIDVDTFINLHSRYHRRASVDPRPQPTVEDVTNMDRSDKELINTPESDFAATDIHIGGIILGHDRWQEIDHWIEFMHRPSEDQPPLKATTDDYPLFENVCDDEIMPKDSATKWDSESVRAARQLAKECDPDYYIKRQRIAKEINPFTGRYNVQRDDLWLNTLPEYNPDLPPRATDVTRAVIRAWNSSSNSANKLLWS